MYDKQVRRRRAVLALLVAVSLILLTAYFGESPSSPLHSVQRGIVQVLSPVQEGASKALKPFSDIAGWFSDTLRARGQVNSLRKQLNYYRSRVAQLEQYQIQNAQLAKELALNSNVGVGNFQPVAANVILKSPTLWYATIEVDKGSADGVRAKDPVLGDGALVGTVSTVDANVSYVTLITDSSSAVSAVVQDTAGDAGLLVPSIGNPNQLVLQNLPQQAQIVPGQQVVTAGFKSATLQSLYPAGIPIGQVADASNLLNNETVTVNPAADLRHLDAVQILTAPHAGAQRAQLP